MGSCHDSRYMTCPGCFQVFDTLEVYGKPFDEYDKHIKDCSKYQIKMEQIRESTTKR